MTGPARGALLKRWPTYWTAGSSMWRGHDAEEARRCRRPRARSDGA
jgi:hypothetical protein